MSATLTFYLKQATQNEQDAANAALDNVRDRALRSAHTWRLLAERLIRAEAIRSSRDEQSEEEEDGALV